MPKKNELSSHWRIVIASGIGVGAGTTGIPFYTMGLFVDPVGTDFGWSRTQVQAMFSVFAFSGLLMAPVIGWLTDRWGVRKVALWSLFGAVLGYLSLAGLTRSLFTYYLGAVCLAALAAGTSPITWTKAIGGWFDKQRGFALGLALSGTGIAGFLAPSYVSWILESHSWRAAYLGLALIPLLALPIVFLLLRNPPLTSNPSISNPSIKSTAADDSDQKQVDDASVTIPNLDLRAAISGYRFWVIATAFFMVSVAIGGTIPNLVPMLTDAAISREIAAKVVGLLGLSVIAGRVVTGIIIDKIWAPGVAAFMLALPALSAIILSQDAPAMPYVVLSVILIGFAAGAEFDLIAYLVSRYFGLVHYGKIYSLQYAAFVIGSGIAPALFAYFYDTQGTYTHVMYLSAGLFVFGSLLLLSLGRYPSRH